jgi:hypothetical protein
VFFGQVRIYATFLKNGYARISCLCEVNQGRNWGTANQNLTGLELTVVHSVDGGMNDEELKVLTATLELFRAETEVKAVTAETIAVAAGIPVDQFLDQFQGAGQALSCAYLVLLDEAERVALSSPLEETSTEERLATFCFVLLDVFEKHENFVRATFSNRASGLFSPFQDGLRSVLASLLDAPDLSGANRFLFNNGVVRFALAESIVQLLARWIEDDSTDKERSTALIDRVVAWWAEVVTTGIPDKSIDVLRYGVEAGYLPLDRIPFIRDWLSK